MITFTTIMPCFNRFPKEAVIIGRLLAGYGELEYGICRCLGLALDNELAAFQALFRMMGGGEARIETAHILMQDRFAAAGLEDAYAHMMGAIRWCKKIRNQYAHCHWLDHSDRGLFFVDMDRAAKMGEPLLTANHVDEALLIQQEKCFCYCLQWLAFLEHEYQLRNGKLKSHSFRAPAVMLLPSLHNPQDQHLPPWTETGDALPQAEPPPTPQSV